MHPELTAGVEALYDAFASYPTKSWVPACACCHDPEDGPLPPELGSDPSRWPRTVLLRAPGLGMALSEIRADDLAWYAVEAPNLVGEEGDWKHYLPRLLDISMREDTSESEWPELEIVIGQLANGVEAPWFDWPDHEADAVRRCLHGFWLNQLDSPLVRDGDHVDTALCAIGRADPDVGWYLDTWEGFNGFHAARCLDAFVQRNVGPLVKNRLANEFWDRHRDPSARNILRIIEWLASDALRASVVEAINPNRGEDETQALESTFDILCSIVR